MTTRTVYFATNRNPNKKIQPDDFGPDFSERGLADLRFGEADVEGPPYEVKAVRVAPENLAPKSGKQKLGSLEVFGKVRENMSETKQDTLIYIHGFNVTFKDGLATAARLADNLPAYPMNVFLFSWPSDGTLFPWVSYFKDRHDAKASGLAFARGFLKVVDYLGEMTPQQACGRKIHLLAHSMGNYVLRNALQEMRKFQAGDLPRLFESIFLMAADEDDDAFEVDYKLLYLPNLARRVHVYFNHEDLALEVSDKTKANPDRLGTDGPRHPRQLPGKVTLVDCTAVVHGFEEHHYYVEKDKCPQVTADLLQILQGIPPEQITGRTYIPETNRYRLG